MRDVENHFLGIGVLPDFIVHHVPDISHSMDGRAWSRLLEGLANLPRRTLAAQPDRSPNPPWNFPVRQGGATARILLAQTLMPGAEYRVISTPT
jgi:hypothetical protein